MKTIKQSTVGFAIEVQIPSSVEEFDQLAGKEGACLEAANNHVMMHSYLGKFRSELASRLEKETGFPRAKTIENEGQDNERIKYDETENVYLGRLEAHLAENGQNLVRDFSEVAQEVATSIPFDVKTGRRSGVGRRPTKKYLAYYETLVAEGKLEAFAEKYDLILGEDEDSNIITVCSKVKELLDEAAARVAQEALAI